MHELADLVHNLDLVRLQMADEVPPECIAVGRVLALEVLCSVFANDLDAGAGECGHLLERDVLRRHDDRHSPSYFIADLRVSLADLMSGGDAHGVTVAASSRAAASSDSRPSSSPFNFRLRSSARTSPICGDSGMPMETRSAPPISSRTERRRVK